MQRILLDALTTTAEGIGTIQRSIIKDKRALAGGYGCTFSDSHVALQSARDMSHASRVLGRNDEFSTQYSPHQISDDSAAKVSIRQGGISPPLST